MLRSCICLGGRLRTAVGRVTRRKAEQLRRLPANRRRTTPTQLRKQGRSGSTSASQTSYKQTMRKWLKGNREMSSKQVSALKQFDSMISRAQKEKENMILQAIVRAQHDFKKQNDETDEMEKAETNRSKFAQKVFAENRKIAKVELEKIKHEKKIVVTLPDKEKELRAELRREAALKRQEIARAERERRRIPKVILSKMRQEIYKKQKETPYSEQEKEFFKMLSLLEAKREAAINSAKQKIEESERVVNERNAEKSFLEELRLIKEKRAAVINKIKEEAKAERERERKEMMEQKRLQHQQRMEEKRQKRREQHELIQQQREQRRMEREEKRRQLQLEKEKRKQQKLQIEQEQKDEANNLTETFTQMGRTKESESAGANTNEMLVEMEKLTEEGKRNALYPMKASLANTDEINAASPLSLNENQGTGDVHVDVEQSSLATSSSASKAKSQRKRRESSQLIMAPTITARDASISNDQSTQKESENKTDVIPLPASISKSSAELAGTTPATSITSEKEEEEEKEQELQEKSTLITPAAKHKHKKTSEANKSAPSDNSSNSEVTEAMKIYYNLLQNEKNRVLASSALSQPVIQSHTRMPPATHKRATSVTSSSRITASSTLSASAHGKRSGKRDSAHSAHRSLSVVPHNELTKTPSASSSHSVRGSHDATRGGQPNRVLRPSTVATWATQQNTSGLFRL